MAKNRYSRPQTEAIDYSPKKKAIEEPTLSFSPCVTCGKAIKQGYYAHIGNDGGVCSGKCFKNFVPKEENHEITHVTAFNGSIYRES